MRIVIEIDGIEVTAKVSSDAAQATSPEAAAQLSSMAGAQIGVEDAGAAPTLPSMVPGAPQPFMLPGLVSQIGGTGDFAAGVPQGMPPIMNMPDAAAAAGMDQAAGAAPGDPGQPAASDNGGGGT